MRKIEIPNEVKVKLPGVDELKPISFYTFMEDAVLPRLGKKLKHVRQGIKVLDKIESAKDGHILVDEETWADLRKALSDESDDWIPVVARQVICYIDAVLEAPEVEV
jgi:hypothetical protein